MRTAQERRALTLPQQHLFLMRSRQVVAGAGQLTPTELTWRFDARPGPLSRTYAVRLRYRIGSSPDVFVERPELRSLSGGRCPPHLYHDPDRLCLYMPSTGEWDPMKRLDETIVPWTYLWLEYFEDWLAMDVWRGGGNHPDPDAPCIGSRADRRRMLSRQRSTRSSSTLG